jgi:hypothetical protein
MATMLKLQLRAEEASLERVRALPGLLGLAIDEKFGLVPLDPKRSLYAVRVEAVDDVERRQRESPELLGSYGDVRVSQSK